MWEARQQRLIDQTHVTVKLLQNFESSQVIFQRLGDYVKKPHGGTKYYLKLFLEKYAEDRVFDNFDVWKPGNWKETQEFFDQFQQEADQVEAKFLAQAAKVKESEQQATPETSQNEIEDEANDD